MTGVLRTGTIYQQQQYRLARRNLTTPKTAVISARIYPERRHEAEEVFRELALTAAQAITLFYKQVELERGLPFVIRVPIDATVEILEFIQEGRRL